LSEKWRKKEKRSKSKTKINTIIYFIDMSTIKIKTSWDEVTLGEYMAISKTEFKEELENRNIKKAVELITALSDKEEEEILDFDQAMFGELLKKISFITTDPKDESDGLIKIGGTDYMFHKDFSVLTTGEALSIEQLLMDAVETKESFLPDLLAILVRPAVKAKNKETGKFEYKLEKLIPENLPARKELFLKELTVPKFLLKLTAFMNGAKESGLISRLSSVRIDEIKRRLERELNH